jgi:PEP-CTERM motif-containing protein
VKRAFIAASLALAATGSQAQSFQLDFGDGPLPPTICSSNADGSGLMMLCGDGARINQSYGDVAGVLDVSYSDRNATTPTSLNWWASNYNDLYGVLWVGSGDANSHARVELKPLGGETINLTHFDLGAWFNATLPTTVDVYEIGSTASLFNFSGPVGSGASTHASFNMNLSSSNGFWIEWRNSAYNVGIDNIDFAISVIPEPGTYAMLMAGLALLGFVARRRRIRVRPRSS